MSVAVIGRPTSFNGQMVRAIIEDRKTHTRRPIKFGPVFRKNRALQWLWKPAGDDGYVHEFRDGHTPKVNCIHCCPWLKYCPLGKPGQRLWVRESAVIEQIESSENFTSNMVKPDRVRVRYLADNSLSDWIDYPTRLATIARGKGIPNGCHREAARIFLQITNVSIQRVRDISDADAIAEGMNGTFRSPNGGPSDGYGNSVISQFHAVWDSIYGTWSANPWVWVVEFKKVEGK